MKGLAPANTLTGKVQRVLTDEWQTRSEIIYGIRSTLSGTEQNSVGFLLDRLVSEGRAESIHIPDPRYMSGHVTKYRRLAVPGQEVGQQGGRASSVPLAEDVPTAEGSA